MTTCGMLVSGKHLKHIGSSWALGEGELTIPPFWLNHHPVKATHSAV